MNHVLAVAALLLVPLAGIAIWRLDGVRELALDARIAIAGAAGALATGLIMSAMSLLGIPWTRTRVAIALLAVIVAGLWKLRRTRSMPMRRDPVALTLMAALFALTAYGLLTARETTGDLMFFWGPKGIHFARLGGIDVDYLRDPHHFLAHRDYPPLLPLLLSWSRIVSREFSWWAALLLSGFCLAGITAMVRIRDDRSALLTLAILAWAFAQARVAGGADPLLLFFEVTAVAALTFLRDARAQTIVAAIGVAGAVMTKVEGASFAIAVILAMLIDRRPWRQIVKVMLPAAVLLGAWLTFLIRAQLLDTYLGPGTLSFQYVRELAKSLVSYASYDAWWIPWIAPLGIVALGSARRARLPLAVAVLTFGVIVYVYLKSPGDPSVFWIPTSAWRVLLTPLAMLLIAAAAAHPAPSPLRRGEKAGVE